MRVLFGGLGSVSGWVAVHVALVDVSFLRYFLLGFPVAYLCYIAGYSVARAAE